MKEKIVKHGVGWEWPGPELPVEVRRQPEIPDAVEFARTRLGIEPDERQAEVLRSEAKRGILNCTRQWGKSTIVAAKAVHRAFTRPNSLVLVASPSYRQSGEFVLKAAEMVSMLDIEVRGDGNNDVSLLFPNGSRIVGLPGVEGRVRGFSRVSMLLIDEGVAGGRYDVPGAASDAGGGERGFVVIKHAFPEKGVLLSDVGGRRAGLAPGAGAGDGVCADSAGLCGGRAPATEGRFRDGIYVRIYGGREQRI